VRKQIDCLPRNAHLRPERRNTVKTKQVRYAWGRRFTDIGDSHFNRCRYPGFWVGETPRGPLGPGWQR